MKCSRGTVSKSNRKIIERGKFDTTNTQIDDLSSSWLGTGLVTIPQTQIHDLSSSWFGTGLVAIPLAQTHDPSSSWVGTGLVPISQTHIYMTSHLPGLIQAW